MYYMFIKMSSKWYYQEFYSLNDKKLRENMIEAVCGLWSRVGI